MRSTFVLVLGLAVCASAEDWPTYRHDIARSGITSEALRPPLARAWEFRPAHAPEPAWDEPNPRPVGGWHGDIEGRRVHFDDAYHVTVSDGIACFGSSADGAVTALEPATGQVRWRTFTEGPVRLAPTFAGGKLYVGSDDGHAYCLEAADGKTVWRVRAAPSGRKVLGSGRMISLWPVRTSVLVEGDTAYLAAGIFPAEGVYLYALRASDGSTLWCNDSATAAPQSRISPQGYLLASARTLFVPLGRVSPAAFRRQDGALLHQAYIRHEVGGSYALLADDRVYTGTEQMVAYSQDDPRKRFVWFQGRQLVIAKDTAYCATGRQVQAFDRVAYPAAGLRKQSLIDRHRSAFGDARKQQQSLAKAKAALDTATQALAAATDADRKRLQDIADGAAKAHEAAVKNLAGAQARLEDVNAEIKQNEADIVAASHWQVASTCADSLILAGSVLYAGGKDEVVAIDAEKGEVLWSAKVDGAARGLAVSSGRLFVSTSTGAIVCFGPEGTKDAGIVRRETVEAPIPADETVATLADNILKASGISKGYGLVLGCGTGRLASELARRTELSLCGIEKDPAKIATARATLDKAGLYGSRIHIEQGDVTSIPYSDYFANLVVCEDVPLEGAVDLVRTVKPLGGVLLARDPAVLRRWLAAAGIEKPVLTTAGDWTVWRRGALPGAGSWTHQYAEPGNTTCSDDQLVKCPLGLLWFGRPGPTDMVERHHRAAAPLAAGGRLFIQGLEVIKAYDSYNGLLLWERKIPGAFRRTVSHEASNFATDGDSLFVAVGPACHRLDAATGETTLTYALPAAADDEPRTWGYVARVGDLLYGTRSPKGRVADCVFALDAASGALRWKYEAETIPQASLSIANGILYFGRADVTDAQREQAMADIAKSDPKAKHDPKAVRLIVALDAATGKTVWEKPLALTGSVGGSYWCSLGSIVSRDVLLLFGVYADGHFWRQFFAGQFNSRRVVALSAKTGEPIWAKRIGYRVRPLVVGDTLHAEPWAFDLYSGEQKLRTHPITGKDAPWQFARPGHHCGLPAAAPNVMLFRSFNLAWYDLAGDSGTSHFGGQRPGCWINFIPANGLLLVPEASSGCMCAFPNACTVVFQPVASARAWSYYSTPGPLTPVKRLALNLAAPGDRKAPDGTLWLGYPRPGGSLVLNFPVSIATYPGGGNFLHDPARLDIAGTDVPWVFRSGVRALRRCVVPVLEPGDGEASFTVRLAFAELDDVKPGERVVDIRIQDKTVAKGFDVAAEAGGSRKALVKEFRGVRATEKISIELVAGHPNATSVEVPSLHGIDIEREAILSLGMAAPAFLLNDAQPEQTAPIVIRNHRDEPFVGTLKLEAPDRFALTVPDPAVTVPAGEEATIPLTARVTQKGERGAFAVKVSLLRADGALETVAQAKLEYLANRTRVVVKAVEDAQVAVAGRTRNYGKDRTMMVDGGDAKLGDHHHSIAYLKFRLPAEGRIATATLRIYNAGNPTGNSGNVCLVSEPWTEKAVTYANRPKPGAVLGSIRAVAENQVVELPLKIDLAGRTELSLVIEPTGCDGVDYFAREGGHPAELLLEVEP